MFIFAMTRIYVRRVLRESWGGSGQLPITVSLAIAPVSWLRLLVDSGKERYIVTFWQRKSGKSVRGVGGKSDEISYK